MIVYIFNLKFRGMELKDNSADKVITALRIARLSLFSALSVVGSFIHPPSPIQTVAFDSAPGFFAALYFGAFDGALICGIGHLCTSIVNGFPLGVLHFPIALGMAMVGAIMGLLNRPKKGLSLILAVIAGIILNTSLFVIAVPSLGWAAALAFVPFLLLAASLNAFVSAIVYVGIRRGTQS